MNGLPCFFAGNLYNKSNPLTKKGMETIMQRYEEQRELVSKLNVIDDVLFHKVVEDKEVCEEILQIILNKPDLVVVESQPQRFLRNLEAHSVILDVLCQDSSGDYFNIEVQKKNDDDHQKRVRFNRSNIDTAFVESGIKYEQLPDVYLIFLTKFDIFGEKHTIYHIERVIKETGTVVENGTHEIYVNTAIDDGTELAELMQYFKKSVGVHHKFQKLSKRVQYFKESQKGVTEMCELVEEYAKKYVEEEVKKAEIKTALNLLQNGISVELVVKSLPSLSEQFVKELQAQLL